MAMGLLPFPWWCVQQYEMISITMVICSNKRNGAHIILVEIISDGRIQTLVGKIVGAYYGSFQITTYLVGSNIAIINGYLELFHQNWNLPLHLSIVASSSQCLVEEEKKRFCRQSQTLDLTTIGYSQVGI
jgi:hypothetical protein